MVVYCSMLLQVGCLQVAFGTLDKKLGNLCQVLTGIGTAPGLRRLLNLHLLKHVPVPKERTNR